MVKLTQLSLFDPIIIPLNHGRFALIDPVDSDLLQYHWYCDLADNRTQIDYAARMTLRNESIDRKQHTLYLHRVILSRIEGRLLNPSEKVDHRDLNGLNNCRYNLRLASSSQNAQNRTKYRNNTTGYKGVHLTRGRWQARIIVNYKHISLGCYDTPEQAHEAYCKAAQKYFGEFARDT